jgi:hypothetical protein
VARNAEDTIRATLESLFRQTVFEKLCVRHEAGEILILAHGCNDRTASLAREICERAEREHDWSDGFSARVIEIPEAGRSEAWNRFVHEFSAVEARQLALMNADIAFHHRDTIANLMGSLDRRPHASIATSRPCKAIFFKERHTLQDRLSLATSEMTGTIPGRITGQLYCIRAKTARNLYLPRDLVTADDGFLRQAIGTDFFSRGLNPVRIAAAHEAAHIYEPCTALKDVMSRQQSQLIGQTTVHVLVEYVKTLSFDDRRNIGETLRRCDARQPGWLRERVAEHIRARPFCWQLFPDLLTFRFQRWFRLRGLRKLTHFPAALAGFAVTLLAAVRAHRVLRAEAAQVAPQASRQPILTLSHDSK